MSKNEYEFVIVGGGLSGCLMAKALSQAGFTDIALIEAASDINVGQNHPHGITSDELVFLPAGQATERAIDFIEQLNSDVIERQEIEIPAITLEKSQFHPFIGFGEKAPAEVEELSHFLGSQRIQTNPAPHVWFQKIKESLHVDILTKSEVTKIEIQDGHAVAAIINGDKRITAKTFILCLPPTELMKLVPAAAIDQKIVQKIAKAKLWTSIILELVHKKHEADSNAVHIITGGESSVCLGQFQTNQDGNQYSQWLSFVSGEEFDEEQTASVLREMKRLIKRAYPQIFENLEFERIVVRQNSHGTIALKLENDFSLPGIDNIWLSSGLLRTEKNLVASILQVKRVFDSIKRSDSAEVASEASLL